MKKLMSAMVLLMIVCPPLAARRHGPQTFTIQIPARPDFYGIEWLIGNWSGKTVGAKPAGTVRLSVSYALDRRIMILREHVSLPATKVAPATSENLIGILSSNLSHGFDLDLYSSHGFVTRYLITVYDGEIRFNPEGGSLQPAGWIFRRTIRHTNPGKCTETVSVAPPGQPFFTYYTADLTQDPPQ